MATKITIQRLSLGDVRPYGWVGHPGPSGGVESHGHDFELVATLSFKKYLSTGHRRTSNEKDGEDRIFDWPQKVLWNAAMDVHPLCLQMPLLTWQENIRFYDVDNNGRWAYVGEYNTDMFGLAPRAKTFGGFYPGISMAGGNGWCDPWATQTLNQGMQTIITRPKPKGFDDASLTDRMYLTALMFRGKSATLKAVLTDRPGCTKNPSGAVMGGGGGQTPLTNSSSRCRVIHFALTFAGTGLPVLYCTQILETQNGVPTICKFIKARMTNTQVEEPRNHLRWRNGLNLNNYHDPRNQDFDLWSWV